MNSLQRAFRFIKENKDKKISPGDIIERCEIFLVIPLLMFSVSPVYQLICSLFVDKDYPNNGFYTYSYTIDFVIRISIVIGLIAILMYFINMKNRNLTFKLSDNIPVLFFALFIICMLVSTVLNGITDAVFHGAPFRNESIISFISYFLIFYFCGSLIEDSRKKKVVIYSFLISNIIIDTVCLFNVYVRPIRIWEYSDSDAASALFYQFNHYGYYLMLAIVISAAMFVSERRLQNRIFCCAVMIVNAYILTLNTTFGCFLACIAGLVFVFAVNCIVNKRFCLSAFVMLILFIAVIYISGLFNHSFINEMKMLFTDVKSVMNSLDEKVITADNSGVAVSAADSAGTGRWGLWKYTFGYIREKPLFGWGTEGIADMLSKDSHGLNNRPHNEYLQYAAFFGIPAAIIYVCGVLAVFLRAWKKRRFLNAYTVVCLAAAFTYCVSAVFGNTMFYTAPFFFIFLGLGFERNTSQIIE